MGRADPLVCMSVCFYIRNGQLERKWAIELEMGTAASEMGRRILLKSGSVPSRFRAVSNSGTEI
jgi:hypothetical protein